MKKLPSQSLMIAGLALIMGTLACSSDNKNSSNKTGVEPKPPVAPAPVAPPAPAPAPAPAPVDPLAGLMSDEDMSKTLQQWANERNPTAIAIFQTLQQNREPVQALGTKTRIAILDMQRMGMNSQQSGGAQNSGGLGNIINSLENFLGRTSPQQSRNGQPQNPQQPNLNYGRETLVITVPISDLRPLVQLANVSQVDMTHASADIRVLNFLPKLKLVQVFQGTQEVCNNFYEEIDCRTFGRPQQQQPGQQQPGYQQPGYQQPGYQQPGYQQPGYQQPGYQQPGYQQPGYQQPQYHQTR